MSKCKCIKEENPIKKDDGISKIVNVEKEYLEEGLEESLEDTPDIEYSSWIQIF